MTATLKSLNLVEGMGAEWTRDGWSLRGTALVEGVEGAGLAGLKEACLVEGMPAPGSAHPQNPQLTLYGVAPEALGAGNVRVILTYRTETGGALGQPNIVTGSRVQSEETWKELDGGNITVTHGGETQPGSVHVLRPHRTWMMTRLETADPGPKSKGYVGRTNKAGGFAPGGDQQAEGTWLCQTLEGRSSDGGRSYLVTYAFEEKISEFDGETKGWDPVAAFIDPSTGRPPDPSTWIEGQTVKVVPEYPPVDFNALHLTEADPLAAMIDWGSLAGS